MTIRVLYLIYNKDFETLKILVLYKRMTHILLVQAESIGRNWVSGFSPNSSDQGKIANYIVDHSVYNMSMSNIHLSNVKDSYNSLIKLSM